MGKKIELTGQKFGRLTVIGIAGKDNRGEIIWHCVCDCGGEKDVLSSNLRKGLTQSCGCLQKEKAGQNTPIKDLTNQRFGKLIALKPTEERLNGQVVWECLCDCGNKIKVRSWNLISNKTCSCGCARSESARLYHNKNLQGQRFGKLTVLEALPFEPDKSGNVYWKCRCDCGNETILYTSLLTQGISSCGCLNMSRGELKISSLLASANIDYEMEKTFKDCHLPDSNRLLRFDFYVNNEYIIEFDGIQHFKADAGWATQEVYKRTVEHDNFKNTWCKNHNIPIIRIPYTHYKNLTINDLLIETSKFIIRGEEQNG